MTGFDVKPSPDFDREVLNAISRPVIGTAKAAPTTTFLQDTLHFLGKPEEWTAKAVGKVFSDDPKYRDIFGSSSYWDQIGFYEVARDAGINQENLGTFGPVLAAVVGLGAAIANPFDPLNKLTLGLGKAGGLTRSGIAGRALAEAENLKTLRTRVLPDGKRIKEIGFQGGDNHAKALRRRYRRNLKSKDPALAREAVTNLPKVERAIREVDEINTVLRELQEKGLDYKDIKLAPNKFRQAQLGQRHLLGMTSPLKFDQLALLGVGRKTLDHASAMAIPLPKTLQGAVLEGIDRAKNVAKLGARKLGNRIVESMNYTAVKQEMHREILADLKRLIDAAQGDAQLYHNGLLNIVRRYNLSAEEVAAVTEALEATHVVEKQRMIDVLGDIKAKGLDAVEDKPLTSFGPTQELGVTSEQLARLRPREIESGGLGVRKARAQMASGASYPNWPIGNKAELTLTGDYAVFTGQHKTNKDIIKGLNFAVGENAYQTAGNSVIATRIPDGARITQTSMFGPEHMDNLDALLARLGRRKLYVSRLTTDDIIVTPLGGVQIVNPKIIGKESKSSSALARSRISLERFLERDTLISKGAMRDFHFLKNLETAKRAPAAARAHVKPPQSDSPVMNVDRLLMDSVNTQDLRDAVHAAYEGANPEQWAELVGSRRAAQQARIIRSEMDRLQQQAIKGEHPTLHPITLTSDAAGNQHVVEGAERAVAAKLAGFDQVPVNHRGTLGDRLRLDKGYSSQASLKLHDAFGKEGLAAGALQDPLIARNYKLIRGSDYMTVPRDATITSADDSIIESVSRMVTLGLPPGAGKNARPGLLLAEIEKQIGGDPTLAITDMVRASNSPQDFAARLEGIGGTMANSSNVSHPSFAPLAAQHFRKLKELSEVKVQEMAKRGALPVSVANDVQYQRLASQTGATVVSVDENANTLRLVNERLSSEELVDLARGFSKKMSDRVDPFARVHVVGSNGEKRLIFDELDFNTSLKDRFARFIETRTEFFVENAELKRWKTEGIEELSPSSDIPDLVKGYKLANKDTTAIPQMPFVITRDGRVFFSKQHQDLPSMMAEMFGHGPAPIAEHGIVSPGRITVVGVGDFVSEISKKEMNRIADRIKSIANKFKDAGFNEQNVLDIRTQFDPVAWKHIYGDRKLGDAAKNSWRIEIPDELDGMLPDTMIEVGDRYVTIEQPRFAKKEQQELFEFIRRELDDAFAREVIHNLPTSYHESYLPRFLTVDAKEAMESAGLQYGKANPEVFKHYESFLKARVLGDLTLPEVNEMFRKIKEIPGIPDDSSYINEVVKFVREEYKKSLSKDKAIQYARIAKQMPNGSEFFISDPLYALSLRYSDSRKAVTRAQMLQSLEEKGIMWTGTPKRIGELTEQQAARAEVRTKIAELNQQIVDNKDQLESLEGFTDNVSMTLKKKIQQRVEDLESEVGKLEIKDADRFEKVVGENGIAINDINFKDDTVWLDGAEVRKLVERGLVRPQDLPLGDGQLLVPLSMRKYASVIEEGGLKVHLFNPEAAGIAQRFFGLTRNRDNWDNFLRFWDEMHTVWRSWTLFPIPSYHLRNTLSNAVMLFLGGVTSVESFTFPHKMFSIVKRQRDGAISLDEARKAMESIVIPSNAGITSDGQRFYEEFIRRGGLHGFYQNEYSRISGRLRVGNELSKELTRRGLLPSSEAYGRIVLDNPMIRAGGSVGHAIEARFRMSAFYDAFVKTGSFDEAEATMKRLLYDYSDLSAFERDVMRRVVPFYTWIRHNTPRMLETMITDPVKHIRLARMLHQIEQGALDRKPPKKGGLQEWMKDAFGVILSEDKDGKYFMKFAEGVFPMYDVYGMFAGKGFLEAFTRGVTPFAKFPIEQLMNKSLFTDREIEKVPGEPSQRPTFAGLGFTRRATTEGVLGPLNLFMNDSVVTNFFRAGSVAAGLMDDMLDERNWLNGEPTWSVAAWDFVLGRGMVVDPERTRASINYKHKDMVRKLDKIEERLRSQGNEWYADEVAKRRMNLELQFGRNEQDE